MIPKFDGRAILAVFAHPDDESLACGGTLACLADHGAHVVLMCASRGELGSRIGLGSDGGLGPVRARELRAAAETLGIASLIILDHPDGNLRWAGVSEFHAQIAAAIRRYSPAAVITFGQDGLYWHPDHIGVHERTTSAVRSLGAGAPSLYYVTMPPGVMGAIRERAIEGGWTAPAGGFWSLAPYAFGIAARPPAFAVDVARWVPRKLAAIRCHQTQTGSHDPFVHLADDEVLRWLGVEHFHRAPGDRAGHPVLESLAFPCYVI